MDVAVFTFKDRFRIIACLISIELIFYLVRVCTLEEAFDAFNSQVVVRAFGMFFLVWQFLGVVLFLLFSRSKFVIPKLVQSSIFIIFFYVPSIVWILIAPSITHILKTSTLALIK